MHVLRSLRCSKLSYILLTTTILIIISSNVIILYWLKIKTILDISERVNKVVRKRINLEFQKKLQEITKCNDRLLEPSIIQHGNFWVLQNYITAEKQFRCSESVTYSTQADYTFLDNLVPLVERWRGPISLALHAPGTDFQPTLDSIAYLRNCNSSLIKKYVTIHLIFDMGHVPKKSSSKPFNVPIMKVYKDTYNCSKRAPYLFANHKNLYKMKANISYPINVGRNIAREGSQTHFVLASDIELYPSPNIIEPFLNFVVRKRTIFEKKSPSIFVLPVFEILSNESVPTNKLELRKLYNNSRAFSFHKSICNRCHVIPQLDDWLNLNVSRELNVFITTKRQKKYVRWEAVYIGTNEDPWFDERLDWERHGNKMSQAYILCLLDYNYMVLDNAFLVHKPGVKEKMINVDIIPITADYINKTLGSQISIVYGSRKGCLA